jgi:hypothetical protein
MNKGRTEMRSKNHPENLTGTPARVREIFEHAIHEFRAGFDLMAFSRKGQFFTGYFVDPSYYEYIHIWKLCISPDLKVFYPDTLREVALIPLDGFTFRHDVFLTMGPSKLRNIGLDIPSDKLGFIFALRKGEQKKRGIKDRVKTLSFRGGK